MLIENYETKRQGELFVKNIREQVFATQIHTSADVFPLRSYGKYLLRYSNDMKSVQHYITRGYIEGLSSTLFLGLGFLLMGQIQSTLTLLLLGLLFLSLLMIIVMTRRQTASIENSRSTRSRLLSFVARQFARFQLLKQRFEETKVISVFIAKSTSLYFSSMKYHLTESIVIALVPVMIMGCVGVMLWRMAYLDESMLASDGFMLVLILLMMEGGIRRILRVPGYLNKGKISLRKIEKMSQGAGREWDR